MKRNFDPDRHKETTPEARSFSFFPNMRHDLLRKTERRLHGRKVSHTPNAFGQTFSFTLTAETGGKVTLHSPMNLMVEYFFEIF
ncbi:MAG: hypothetical protein V3W37_01015 [Candidatus Binatia bacterium]